jgi:hypothetical protein
MILAPAQLAVLEALCRRMVPLADAPDPAAKELARAVQERLAAAPPADARRVGVILELLDHPATALVGHRSLRRFTRLDARGQDARLREMETSALPPVRTLFQALRRLILSTHYARPASHVSIGYLGPLHTREPAVDWEGPLAGADGTPVAPRVLHPTPRELRVFSDSRTMGITEGAQLGADTRIRADVCVIGTGAGGAVAAARLAEAGHQVVILEEGGHWRGDDFTEDEATMTARLYADAGARATDDLAIPILQGRAYDSQLDADAPHAGVGAGRMGRRARRGGDGRGGDGARLRAHRGRDSHPRGPRRRPQSRQPRPAGRRAGAGMERGRRPHQRAGVHPLGLLRARVPLRRQAGDRRHVHPRRARVRRAPLRGRARGAD